MSKTFIVRETETRVWRVEINDETVEAILACALPITGDGEHLKLSAADFIDEPDPKRGTIMLLSSDVACKIEEVELKGIQG